MKRRTLILLAVAGYAVFHLVTAGHRSGRIVQYCYRDNAVVQYLDLHVPDAVVTYGSPSHIHISGTALSMIVPEGFEQTVDFRGFTDGDTSIRVTEDHSTGLGAGQSELEAYIAYSRHDQQRYESLLYRRDFRFNGYDAFIVCVQDTASTRTVIYMAFGDDSFHVAMTGTIAQNTAENRAEILNTMLTANYPKA